MTQKIIQIGNSVGAVIPQAVTRDLGLKAGDLIFVEQKGEKVILSPIKKSKKDLARGVDAKFMQMVDSFIKDHEDVLQELAHK